MSEEEVSNTAVQVKVDELGQQTAVAPQASNGAGGSSSNANIPLIADDDGNGVYTAVIDLKTVTAHEKNYNYHPEAQAEKLDLSLGEFGYVRRIVVQEKVGGGYTAVAGHGMADALHVGGYRNIEATVLPADWPSWKVLAYLVTDNETAKGAVVQDDLLQAILQEVAYDGGAAVLDGTGISDEEAQGIIAGVDDGEEPQWGDAFDKVPDQDRAPFQQMTFTLHDTQVEAIREAMGVARGMGEYDSENENGNGNALARICETFVTDHG